MSKKKNVNVEVITEEENIEVEKKGVITKAKGFIVRNGKKIAIGAIGAVGLGIGYALGKKSSDDENVSDEGDYFADDYFADNVESEE